MKKTPKEIKGKETKFGKEMVAAGFPYCYRIKGVDKHCQSCIKYYKEKRGWVFPKLPIDRTNR